MNQSRQQQPVAVAEPVVVQFVVLGHALDLEVPTQASAHSAGWDLRAAVAEPVVLAPLERRKIPTGLIVAVPPGYEAQVRPRSGRALREGLGLVNAPGTIDSDYRGEIGVLLINLGQERLTVERGDRIAQLVITPVPVVRWERAQRLDETQRGSGGFGSSGR